MFPSGCIPPPGGQNPVFQTTHWSVILQAASGDSAAALERLCGTYWYPLYAFLRRSGEDMHQAQDLTQGFFEVFLAKDYLKDVDRDKGRFRAFLLASLKHYAANERKKARRQKRGGDAQILSFDVVAAEEKYHGDIAGGATPEAVFDRTWAQSILDIVMRRLRAEFEKSGKSDRFEELSVFLFQEPPPGEYARLAEKWKVTESGVRSSVQRVRQRYAALFREEISATVSDPRDVEGEIAHLASMLLG